MSIIKHLSPHPLADIFPLLTGAEFDALVEDVRANGVLEPIWICQGKILDGRNRYRAARAAGVHCPTQTYEGTDPLGFVVSLNLKRRHLSPSQLAFVALDIERIEAERAKERMKAGGGDKKSGVQQIAPPIEDTGKARGLNQADEYGHAERHYDCLDDNQLCEFRPDGKRLVKELADDNSVLFMWVTAPMLERSFLIIKAWGFEYKTFFVWDKVKHNVGYYNSVRAELLLVCTRGSCTPDTGKLIDSVQSIERSNKHSQKPVEFYDIIEAM